MLHTHARSTGIPEKTFYTVSQSLLPCCNLSCQMRCYALIASPKRHSLSALFVPVDLTAGRLCMRINPTSQLLQVFKGVDPPVNPPSIPSAPPSHKKKYYDEDEDEKEYENEDEYEGEDEYEDEEEYENEEEYDNYDQEYASVLNEQVRSEWVQSSYGSEPAYCCMAMERVCLCMKPT